MRIVGLFVKAMQHVQATQAGFGCRLVGAAVAPFVLASAYLVLTRWPWYRFTASSDYAALVVSLLAGAALVAMLPIRPLHRVLSLLVYVPAVGVLLFFYTFWFIAIVFHDAL